jgi:hypothetical protein
MANLSRFLKWRNLMVVHRLSIKNTCFELFSLILLCNIYPFLKTPYNATQPTSLFNKEANTFKPSIYCLFMMTTASQPQLNGGGGYNYQDYVPTEGGITCPICEINCASLQNLNRVSFLSN